jgi:hypothetical protein
VFSTGTWLEADGVQPGFRESQFLHADGYFQFADSNNSGSEVVVRARGNEGAENFNLLINGSIVGSFTTSTGFTNFSYTATDTVVAGDVRVEFTNDAWDPANGIDNNLIVDYIRIDGQTFQTEAPSVFSTGTWLEGDGIQPGFRQRDTLHSNGYFQWAVETLTLAT